MQIEELTQQHIALWWEGDGAPDWGPVYTAAEQAEREGELARFQDTVAAETERLPRAREDQEATQQRILAALQGVARAMGIEPHIGQLLRSGMIETARGFAQSARRFDRSIRGDDIFQAGRNVWTMNCLQLLLGLAVQVTPAVFAYSLLYPYSDNYLDDPHISPAAKVAFNERFGHRLTGEPVEPANAAERTIFDLVGMIEGQYGRTTHPEVHESLLAIHHAQERSVRLLRRNAPPYEVDVLGISLEKGGASVLADGYLVAGQLPSAQEQFMFGLGTLLQLADDLQDVQADSQAGLVTVFSQAAGRWPLDSLADRTWRFGRRLLTRLVHFDAPGTELLKELIPIAGVQLLIQAAAGAGQFFTRAYLHELERHSPFRFAFLQQRQKKLGRQRGSLVKLIEAFAAEA